MKDGKLSAARFELVCLVAYEENKDVDAPSAQQIKENIETCIAERWAGVADDIYSGIRGSIIERINYIVFPAWSLEALLKEF